MEEHADNESVNLHPLRHSTAHIMAEAIGMVFPGAKFGIGPATEEGFYYDVDVGRPLTEDDLAAIEEQMRVVVKRNSLFVRKEVSSDEAGALFRDQPFKQELIQTLEGVLTVYEQGGFTDLCRGPHMRRTGECRHYKLLKVSGAYWRGDQKNAQLQRIYGTVWPSAEQLARHLYLLEEAKKRDHRKVGQALGLFMLHEWAPGSVFWLPKGEMLYHTLSEAMRSTLLGVGYVAVRTPLLFDSALWELSGHWSHYQKNMFPVYKHEEGEAEGRVYALKAMNCPCHMLIYRDQKRSYRELPLRIHDQGVLHRDEAKGALGGLTRMRQFCQDDAHIFATDDQIESEVTQLIRLVHGVYSALGLDYKAKLSTRPADKLGDDNMWDRAEGALAAALATNELAYTVGAGDGAFYGPKIDFDVIDALGRPWQCATIQLDYQLPQRFKLTYVGADNAEHVPVVIHRAVFGSFERFIGILIEHFNGAFPMWLAPEQVRVMTVSAKSEGWAREVVDALSASGVRAHLDDRSDKIGSKIREAHAMKPVYLVVIGEREQDARTVSVKSRDGDLGAMGLDTFLARCVGEAAAPDWTFNNTGRTRP